MNPHESESLYDRAYALSRSTPSDNWLFDVIVQLVVARPGWQILDVGCNTGELVERFSRLKCRAMGIDINAQAIALAMTRFPGLRFQTSELSDLADSGFDAIIASHVIEHLGQPEVFLEAARKRLKPTGKLVLVTPNRDAFVHALCHRLRGIPLFHDPTHVRLFSPRELRRLVSGAGFRCVQTVTHELYFPSATHLPRKVRLAIPGFGMGDHLCLVAAADTAPEVNKGRQSGLNP